MNFNTRLQNNEGSQPISIHQIANDFGFPCPKTEREIFKLYVILQHIGVFKEVLENIKLPKVNSWEDYFILNPDGLEYYILDADAGAFSWDFDEMVKAVKEGKILLIKNGNNIVTVSRATFYFDYKQFFMETSDSKYYSTTPL